MNRLSGRLAYTWHATRDERVSKPRAEKPKPEKKRNALWNPWSPKEDALLMQSYTVAELVKMTGRTENAIDSRRKLLRSR